MSGKRGLVWFGNVARKCVSINVSTAHNLLIYFYSQYRYSANVQGSGGHRNLQKRRRWAFNKETQAFFSMPSMHIF